MNSLPAATKHDQRQRLDDVATGAKRRAAIDAGKAKRAFGIAASPSPACKVGDMRAGGHRINVVLSASEGTPNEEADGRSATDSSSDSARMNQTRHRKV